jgi:hypothetical protein
LAILELMLDKIPQADRILIAQLHGEAQRHARRGAMAEAEHQAAVQRMRKLAGAPADLLAHVCGIELGFGEGEPAETVSLSLRVAALCREADADEAAIAEWTEIGRQRRADARMLPFSGGVRPPPGALLQKAGGVTPPARRPVPAGRLARYRRKQLACCGKSGCPSVIRADIFSPPAARCNRPGSGTLSRPPGSPCPGL